MRRSLLPLLGLLACGTSLLMAQAAPPASPERLAFDTWLRQQATTALEARRTRLATLTTPAAIGKRQRELRTWFDERLGIGATGSSPLNAVVTRTTRRDGYRIEHVVFESLPGFKVTALAYVPDGTGPFPAVVGMAGHANEGKASATYQHAWVSLVRRGFLVLAVDPFGQGERVEYLDASGTSTVGIGTREHSMTGQQVLLTGRTLGGYMVHDLKRALDYLQARGDVDGKRLAVAGNSGGGTQAALLAAVEPRLAAAVVSCYMTSWGDMWMTPGPQDAEQILPGFVSDGLDFADFAVAAAPRGFLVSSAIRDFFPIAGSRRVTAELTPIFAALGAGDRLARVENDAEHGWTPPLREGAYRALSGWLGGRTVDSREAPVTTESIAALNVTASGQLATAGGTRTVRGINAEEATRLAKTRPALSTSALTALLGPAARAVSPRALTGEGAVVPPAGKAIAIDVAPGLKLAGRLYRPTRVGTTAVLLIGDAGATTEAARIAALRDAGHAVLALDVRGTGALAPGEGASGYAGAYQFAARAWLLGTSVPVWQAEDVRHGLAVLRGEFPSATTLTVHAVGQSTVGALLAAQVERLSSLVLEDALLSLHDVARADVHDRATLAIVPGILRVTDLPELMARVTATKVRLLRPRDATGAPVPVAAVPEHLGRALPTNVSVEP
ncbi:MAG TPA: acetylxylan esterase [Luteitalea sp.]|nr:acetylxylan esterase [Luteitalea sp.]